MYKMYEMELAGRTLRVDVDRVAKQANGAVLMHITKDFTLAEKSREDLIKEKGKHPKTQF